MDKPDADLWLKVKQLVNIVTFQNVSAEKPLKQNILREHFRQKNVP